MKMKIFLLLLMEMWYKATALHSHESSVLAEPWQRRLLLEPSTAHHPIIPSQPYSKGAPGHTPHVPPLRSGHKKRRHKKLVSPPQRRNSFPHKPVPAQAVNPHDHSIAIPPSVSPSPHHGPASLPSIPYHKHHHRQRHNGHSQQGPSMPPYQPTLHSSRIWSRTESAPAPSPTTFSDNSNTPSSSPSVTPLASIPGTTKASPPLPVLALPPPPPNTDCSAVACTEPLTYTPAGSACGCVLPIQVKLRLDVAIYAFFPLVSELAEEVAAGIALNHSQVRIMGADAATQQLEKTAVLVNLVPKTDKFDYVTAFRIYDKFWRRQVPIKDSIFGNYQVLYVHYPGLPPSPPPAPFSISAAEDGPFGTKDDHGMPIKPLGVDVASRTNHAGLGKRTVAVIAVSSFAAFFVLLGTVWVLLASLNSPAGQSGDIPQPLTPSTPKPTAGLARAESGRGSRESVSLSSGTMTYTGSAKIFMLSEIERATNSFEASRVLGEGGFGLVYSGTLDDGREVAVKILKRDDQQGGREFLAEVEMLSRLHHRNLVKLIGICTEGQTRCLVYELVPNGSVESHLHGADKEADPLDWDARMKIALGAARGLAYLHEDSNPRVIHRDFKSSNILLERDFTPKVSDFGLARAALDGDRHISTHVMGTFGYLAPEYAMTGHLLVKSDVYSYGVVLLELLTGRKPVDLTQPPGQENLVGWVRPLLTNREALDTIIDPALRPGISSSLDSAAKVAAIASMCVQPEVSHRPFMGEVVQALKLVCSDFSDDNKGHVFDAAGAGHVSSSSRSHDVVVVSQHDDSNSRASHNDGDDGDDDDSNNRAGLLSTAELLRAAPEGIEGRDSGSFRRYSSSGPLVSGQNRPFWRRLRSMSWGSVSEHGLPLKIWSASR